MKSKQLNFFILPEDWAHINDFLSQNDVKIITQPLYDTSDLCSYDISTKDEKQFKKVYLTCDTFKDNILIEFIDTQNYYLVDDTSSYVVEFSVGGFYSNTPGDLERARLYFVTQYYQNGVIIRKSKEFIKWVDNFFNEFKIQFLSDAINGYGISHKALSWMNKNSKSLSDSGLGIK